MKRRTFLAAAILAVESAPQLLMQGAQSTSDPWPESDLLEPEALANTLKTSENSPTIICVAFPFLYRQRHIVNAQFAGPASKPEGIKALKDAVATLPKNAPVVLYCGCCPMPQCPNIRPAYSTLKNLGFTNVRVLDLPTNFHTDWTAKGYPVQPKPSHSS